MNVSISREAKNTIKRAIRERYAWPGGYPLFILTNDGAALCVDCSRKEFRNIAWDWTRRTDTGWFAVAADINWEDKELCCDHCGHAVDAAYS